MLQVFDFFGIVIAEAGLNVRRLRDNFRLATWDKLQLTAAVRDCSEFVHPIVHGFSTKVADHSLADLAAGRVTSTWGTDIGCVAEHARRHGVKRAVLITDGYVGRARGIDAETLGSVRLAVAYTGGSCNVRDLAPFSGRHDTLEVN